MECALIFPHQLFDQHPAVAPGRRVFLLEDPLFMGTDERWPMCMHRQKVILHRASMQAYARRLEERGYDVRYLTAPPGGGRTEAILEAALPGETSVVHMADPVDEIVSRRLRRVSHRKEWRLQIYDTPAFLSPPSFLDECFAGGQKPFMARFYQRQRLRMRLLISADGKPAGGQWSFDEENRKRLPAREAVPPAPWQGGDRLTRQFLAETDRLFPRACGMPAPFLYPVTHEDASGWLNEFLELRLSRFGDYEDAISSRYSVIFHSVLTPALNIGLLTPGQVIERTLIVAQAKRTPLNSLEGFVRQIIGWREFMRAMYEKRGNAMRRQNF